MNSGGAYPIGEWSFCEAWGAGGILKGVCKHQVVMAVNWVENTPAGTPTLRTRDGRLRNPPEVE